MARDLERNFKEKRYLCMEVNMQNVGANDHGMTPAAAAIEKLSKVIERMESEVEKEIRQLDEKTKEMIELVR